MADTSQIVCWALEQSCVFRTGQGWFLPDKTFDQLHDLRVVARSAANGGVVDGICITEYGLTNRALEASGIMETQDFRKLPSRGFRIGDRLGKNGNPAEAAKICGQCQANAEGRLPMKIAGCSGYLRFHPDSADLDKMLLKAINERGTETRLTPAFAVTKPLWYGLWIESPLKRPQAALLLDLFDAAFGNDSARDKQVFHFCNALKAAVDWDLPLHVAMAPPGHTDMGWYTVFPHCPRCKASAPFKRWQNTYPTTPYKCQVCGHDFVPNDHHSMTRDNFVWRQPSLEETLGKQGYEQFLRTYLRHRGYSEAQVEQVIPSTN
jgi:hypothetical protein